MYTAYAMTVVMYIAQLLPLDPTMLLAEHMALARIFGAPMYALSPGIVTEVGALGCRHPPHDMRRLAWACRLRAVVRSADLALAVQRVDAAILEDRCLAPRMGDWIRQNVIADLRVALRHAAGLPQAIREHPKPQNAIFKMLAAEAGATCLPAAWGDSPARPSTSLKRKLFLSACASCLVARPLLSHSLR